jgi:hypothetical protein
VVPDADAQTPFQYSVFPVSLTVTEKFIPEGYTPQKATSISSQIDEEIRKDRIRAAYNAAENDPSPWSVRKSCSSSCSRS